MHEAEIALVDLVAHDTGALTIEQPAGADMLGGIHEDIDLAADIGRQIRDGFLVTDIERHDLDPSSARSASSPGNGFHGSATPTNTIDAPAAFSAATTS